MQRAIEKGFDLDMYIKIFGELCEDIKTNTAQTISDKLQKSAKPYLAEFLLISCVCAV